jgi:hypothetical protein
MNLLKRLFSHHPQSQDTPSPFIRWPGQSGKDYQYEIHPIDTGFKSLPGNFIYAKQSEDGTWVPIFIAQTRDLHQRLEGHVSVADAMANGATHVHIHYCTSGQAARCTEERDLILLWKPLCNDPIET